MTRMEPPMYRMVVAVLTVVGRPPKGFPLRGSCLRSRLKRCPPMPRSSITIDELCPAWTPLPTRCAGHLPLQGQCHQLKEKYLLSRPKGFPLRGSCLRSRLKKCPRYTSFVYSDRRSYPSGDTSSDPLRREASPLGRGTPSPPRQCHQLKRKGKEATKK